MGKLVSVLLTYVIEELRFCQRDNNNNNKWLHKTFYYSIWSAAGMSFERVTFHHGHRPLHQANLQLH